MTTAEAGMIVGLVVTIAAFVFGIMRLRSNDRNSRNNPGSKEREYVLKHDCEGDRAAIVESIGEVRKEQMMQGKMLAGIDKMVKFWVEKNGYGRK